MLGLVKIWPKIFCLLSNPHLCGWIRMGKGYNDPSNMSNCFNVIRIYAWLEIYICSFGKKVLFLA